MWWRNTQIGSSTWPLFASTQFASRTLYFAASALLCKDLIQASRRTQEIPWLNAAVNTGRALQSQSLKKCHLFGVFEAFAPQAAKSRQDHSSSSISSNYAEMLGIIGTLVVVYILYKVFVFNDSKHLQQIPGPKPKPLIGSGIFSAAMKGRYVTVQ